MDRVDGICYIMEGRRAKKTDRFRREIPSSCRSESETLDTLARTDLGSGGLVDHRVGSTPENIAFQITFVKPQAGALAVGLCCPVRARRRDLCLYLCRRVPSARQGVIEKDVR